jgi:hypothetical protein
MAFYWHIILFMFEDLLLPMFDDEYYPDILVAEVKQQIKHFSKKVGRSGLTEAEIYHFAHHTMIAINEMKPQFEDLDSSLDDTKTNPFLLHDRYTPS